MNNITKLFAVLLLLSAIASGQTTTTVTGTIRDLSQNVVTSGQVTFELRPSFDSTISGFARFTPSTITCSINQASAGTSSAVRAANSVTISGLTGHTFVANDVITVTGMTDSSFNGTFTIGSTTATSITYPQTAGNATTGSGVIAALRSTPGPGSCTVTMNTALNPSGTSYRVCIMPKFISPGSCFNDYAVTTTKDLTTVVPTPTTSPAFTFVDLHSSQTIDGNKTFTGSTSFTGSLTMGAITATGLTVTGASTLANVTMGTANTLNVNSIKQQAGAAFTLTDPLGISHFFISNVSPYTNTFVNGNGAGVVFLGSAAKTSVADTTGNIVTAGTMSLQTTAQTLSATFANDTLGGLLFTTNAGKGWQIANSGQLQSFAGVNILLQGSSSGGITLAVPAAAGSNTLTFPAATDTVAVLGTQQNFTAIQRLTSNRVAVASDFTTANNTNLQAITGLSWSFPATAANYSFHCAGTYSQATANVAVTFGIQAVTNNPTNIMANGQQQLTVGSPATFSTGTGLTNLTTTTATAIVAGVPGATATGYTFYLDGTLELAASANTVNIMVSTAAGADAVTVKRGSYCMLY